MKHLKPLFLFVLAVLISSCSIRDDEPLDTPNESINAGTVSLEDALETLNEFMASHGQEMHLTKSGSQRRISSISTYPAADDATKSVDSDSVDMRPIAYIVNFEDDEGFAVLGAKESIPKIIAITEGGYIDPLTLRVYDRLSDIQTDADDDWSGSVLDSQYYCEEDGDYYSASGADDNPIVSGLIRTGTYDPPIEYGDYTGPAESRKYAECTPLVRLNWTQDEPYNKHCKRGTNGKETALAGCSNIALSMMVTANEFPNQLTINGVQLSWPAMKSSPEATSLRESGEGHVALLVGYVYNNVLKLTSKNYTMITPEQIKKRLVALGYTNVVKHKSSSFDSGMIRNVSKMLSRRKPVFISAIPKQINHAHSWFIDGATYNQGEYLLHFNFGWEGRSNGYFSVSCLNPAKAVIYDDPDSGGNIANNYLYVWHFRLLTYDIPSESVTKSVTF